MDINPGKTKLNPSSVLFQRSIYFLLVDVGTLKNRFRLPLERSPKSLLIINLKRRSTKSETKMTAIPPHIVVKGE